MKLQRPTIQAMLLMAGMIIGAGIFAVPYVFARSGVLIGIATLLVVGAVVMATHLMYADIIFATGGRHRLVGNVDALLGPRAGTFATVLVTVGNLASLLVYMVLGGTFFHALFGAALGMSLTMWQLVFFAAGVACLGIGPSLVNRLNSALTGLMIALFGILSVVALRHVHIPNLLTFHPAEAGSAYGVVLFSLFGINAIPEMAMLLGRSAQSQLVPAVKQGTMIAAAVTLVFGVAIAGFNGPYTSKDAITGLASQLGMWVLIPGAVTGLLAVFTSFIILALNLDETFLLDFRLTKWRALAATTLPVLIAFLLGARDVVSIISFTGTIMGGTTCLLIALMYRKLQQQKTAPKLRYGRAVPLMCITLLVLGLLGELKSIL